MWTDASLRALFSSCKAFTLSLNVSSSTFRTRFCCMSESIRLWSWSRGTGLGGSISPTAETNSWHLKMIIHKCNIPLTLDIILSFFSKTIFWRKFVTKRVQNWSLRKNRKTSSHPREETFRLAFLRLAMLGRFLLKKGQWVVQVTLLNLNDRRPFLTRPRHVHFRVKLGLKTVADELSTRIKLGQ